MERKNRPVGREKNVGKGSASANRRGEGLNLGGPAGSKDGYKDRTGSGSTPQRPVGGNTGSSQRSSGQRQQKPGILWILILAFILLGGGGGLSSLFLGGDTGMSSSHDLLNSYSGTSDSWGNLDNWGGSMNWGGSANTNSSGSGTTSSGYSNTGSTSSNTTSTNTSISDMLGSLLGDVSDLTTGGAYGTGGNTGTLDTEVSGSAREKRTVIRGNGKDQVTIMVYMCGTDLESRSGMGTSDIQEMLSAELSDQINLLVYTGGCKSWKNNVISSNTNQVYQVKKGGLVSIQSDVGSKSMTDPATLAEYIRWAKKNFPADRYELIMWDHGGGSTSGFGYDEKFASSSSMTLDKMAEALKSGGCTFDFIGFDACLMATLETALVVEPYADYLIASEETEPGVGWYYTNWLTKLSKNTSMATVEVGKNIIDDFVSVCERKTPGQSTTLSITDLAELSGTLPAKFKNFSTSITELVRNQKYDEVSTARSRTHEFAQTTYIDQVDLIHLAQNLGNQESQELISVLSSAVKYNLTSKNVRNAYGLSIYFPYAQKSKVNTMINTYNQIGLDSAYSDCIKSFASVQTAGQSVYGGNQGMMNSLFGSMTSGGSSYSSYNTQSSDAVSELLSALLGGRNLENLGLDSESAGFLDQEILESNQKFLTDYQFDQKELAWTNKNDQKVLVLDEEQWNLIHALELNVFVDDGSGYIDLGLDNVYEFTEDGDLLADFDGTWMTINGQLVAYYMMSAEGTGEDYEILGRVPAMLNGEQVNLILCFTDEDPEGAVLGASYCYAGGETETMMKGLIKLKKGDKIDFICDYYDYDRNFQNNYMLGEQLVVTGNLQIENRVIEGSGCLATYRLTDLYNNHYWTPTI
ncbi:MAG: peptidase C11 [Blautia sp.]|nr:peptidase C11 [Blautia sp.]